jgi:hypothetical protein
MQISIQLRHEDLDLLNATAASFRPLVHAGPPVFTRSAREPRQQMKVQMRDSIADHRGVHVLSPSHLAKRLARARAPQTHALSFSLSQIGQPRRMTQRLDEKMPQIGGRAVASQCIRRNDVRNENQLIFRDRSARHERSTVAMLSADKAVCVDVLSGHVRNLPSISPRIERAMPRGRRTAKTGH